MLKNKFFFIALLTLFILPAALRAQVNDETDNPPPEHSEEQPRRPNLLQQLNLTPEQVKQIREINQKNRETVRAKLDLKREAERLLDEAVYADAPDENLINDRLQKVQQLQLELMKMRTLTEFAVRRILTPEQLTRFREIRQNFLQTRENRNAERQNPQNKSMRLKNRSRN